MSDTENKELFTTRMRKATRKIHSISDALVNAKFAISLRDEKVWGGGLFVFYHIFSYLEDARKRLNDGDFDKLYVDQILERKQAFEEDLKHYLGDDWQSTPKSRELENYLQHLQDLESENPSLLMAYVYHLYLGLLSGGQILAKKRRMFGDSTPEPTVPALLDETATSPKSPSSEPSISTNQEKISKKETGELKSKEPALNLLEDDVEMTSSLEINDSEKELALLRTAVEESESISSTAMTLENKIPPNWSSVSLEEWNSMSKSQNSTEECIKNSSANASLEETNTVHELVQVTQENENCHELPKLSTATIELEDNGPQILSFVSIEEGNSMRNASANVSSEETNSVHELVKVTQENEYCQELPKLSTATIDLEDKAPNLACFITLEKYNSMTKNQRKHLRRKLRASSKFLVIKEETNTANESVHVQQENETYRESLKTISSTTIKGPTIEDSVSVEKKNAETKSHRQNMTPRQGIAKDTQSELENLELDTQTKNTTTELSNIVNKSVQVKSETSASRLSLEEKFRKIVKGVSLKVPISVSLEVRNSLTKKQRYRLKKKEKNAELNKNVNPNSTENPKTLPESSSTATSEVKTVEPTIPSLVTSTDLLTKSQKRKLKRKAEKNAELYKNVNPDVTNLVPPENSKTLHESSLSVTSEVKTVKPTITSSVTSTDLLTKSQRRKLKRKAEKSAELNKNVILGATDTVSTENPKTLPERSLSTVSEIKTIEPTIPSSVTSKGDSLSKSQRRKLKKKAEKNAELYKNVNPNATNTAPTENPKILPESSQSEIKTIEPTISSSITSKRDSLSKSQRRKIKKKENLLNQPIADSSENVSTDKPPEKINTEEIGLSRKMSHSRKNRLSGAQRRKLKNKRLSKADTYENVPTEHVKSTTALPAKVAKSAVDDYERKQKMRLLKLINDEKQRIAQLAANTKKISARNESLDSDASRISSVAPVSKRKNTRWLEDQDEEISHPVTKRGRYSCTEALSDSTESMICEFSPREPIPLRSNFSRQPIPNAVQRITIETVVNENNSMVNEHTHFSPATHTYMDRQDSQRLRPNQDRQYPQLWANTNPQELMCTSANELREHPQSWANKERDDRRIQADDYDKRMMRLDNIRTGYNEKVCPSNGTERRFRNPWFENQEKSKTLIYIDDLDDACCVAITNTKHQIFPEGILASIRFQVGEAYEKTIASRRIPSFRQVITTSRYINVWCEDFFTVEWLRYVVSYIKSPPNLIVCKQSELYERINEIFFSVPNEPGLGVTDLIHSIQTQNAKWFDIDKWTLKRLQRSTAIEDYEWEFYFEISDTEIEKLKTMNNHILYQRRMIKVDMKSYLKIDSISEK